MLGVYFGLLLIIWNQLTSVLGGGGKEIKGHSAVVATVNQITRLPEKAEPTSWGETQTLWRSFCSAGRPASCRGGLLVMAHEANEDALGQPGNSVTGNAIWSYSANSSTLTI